MSRKTIEEMLREKAEIESAIAAEYDRTKNWTLGMKLADTLHERCCTSNHIDCCGWGYEDWSGDKHTRYLRGAEALIHGWDKTHPVTDPKFIDKAVALILGAVRP